MCRYAYATYDVITRLQLLRAGSVSPGLFYRGCVTEIVLPRLFRSGYVVCRTIYRVVSGDCLVVLYRLGALLLT